MVDVSDDEDLVDDDAGVLFGDAAIPRGEGRHERAARKAIAAAVASSALLADEDAAICSAVLAGARALDQAETGRGPKATYATAAILSPYREVLQAAGLAPQRTETPATGAAAFLEGLGPS